MERTSERRWAAGAPHLGWAMLATCAVIASCTAEGLAWLEAQRRLELDSG